MDLGDLTITRRTLDNGLTLCAVPLPGVHRAVLHAQLGIGSRFESATDNGISHFLEHMLYRGTPSHPSAHQLALAIEREGGALDATTACDVGTLTLTAPPGRLLDLVPIFAEVFQRPTFDGIDIERGIVREELLEGLDDDGRAIDPDDLVRELSFAGHPLGYSIAGDIERLEQFDVERLRAHHERFYTGDKTVIVVAGPLDERRALATLELGFASLRWGEPVRVEPPPPQREVRSSLVTHASSQASIRLAFRAPGWSDPDQVAMEVLVRLLDDGMSTRLYHNVCDRRGLCYEVSAGYESYADSGLLDLCAETSHDQAPEVLMELLSIVGTLRDQGPLDDELAALQRRYRWQAETMLDAPDAVAEYVADAVRGGRDPSVLARAEHIARVSAEDVRAAAQRWWIPAHTSLVVVGSPGRTTRRRLERALADWR